MSARATSVLHVATLLAVSSVYESLFVHHGLGLFDEGWVLWAAKRLHEGHSLYRDILLVFPPGHVLSAWIGYAIEPPGIVATRVIYAGFNVALCLAMYALGRRLVGPWYAFLAALLLALAAPWSHQAHYLFGYRYLVIPVCALLAFSQRLLTGDVRWTFAAGLLTGVAVVFRLTPAFATACGIGVAVMVAGRDRREWLRDWRAYAAGLLVAAGPVVLWFAVSVGPVALFTEVVVRPAAMLDQQSLPLPQVELPDGLDRQKISHWFTAAQYRLYAATYCVYALSLAWMWLRAGRAFDRALLVAVAVWGGVYFMRTQGRSDVGHLESALPPVCLLLAHAARATLTRLRLPAAAQAAACAVAFGAWIFLFGTDRYLDEELRGSHPVQVTGGSIRVKTEQLARVIDNRVSAMREQTAPDEELFILAGAPLFHLLADRGGHSHSGLIVPATFLNREEERIVLEQLQASPPALVVTSMKDFDDMPSRAIQVTAPLLARWVAANYESLHPSRGYVLLSPRSERLP